MDQVTEATLNLMKAEAQVLANKEGKIKVLVVWNVTDNGTACDFDIVNERSPGGYINLLDYPANIMKYIILPKKQYKETP
jgi:hypothetical protein